MTSPWGALKQPHRICPTGTERSKSGFVDEGLLIFHSKKTGEYGENSPIFEDWFKEILANLPLGSIVVMDNASNHSRTTEQVPTQAHGETTKLKTAELLILARQHFPNFKKYVVNQMAKASGMKLLRLSLYNCELNPIELMAQIKIARENTFKLADVKKLLEAAVKKINEDNWVKHAEKGPKLSPLAIERLAGRSTFPKLTDRARNNSLGFIVILPWDVACTFADWSSDPLETESTPGITLSVVCFSM
ncbi:hypothetical protein NQ317_016729 [Molorchus minor]|uniref:Tc1-like transposase DDE domain-containing protein n=1 Tax=Molorchus minor TaxID=1323400 RepID=A0ABQ9IUH5_9CUCU|nr:hypothetical protein NQ317_016729 [Molorchus minor]